MDNFLPEAYEVPKTGGNYLKFEKGQNRFRIVSSAIIGYEYWNKENKPVRLREMPQTTPVDLRKDSKIKHFWAFVVIDRKDGKIKIGEVIQSTIMQSIKALVDNEDWGDPKGYDLTVTKVGEDLDTKYTVQPSPHKPLTEEEAQLVAETKVNLNALYDGENPFEEKVEIAPVE